MTIHKSSLTALLLLLFAIIGVSTAALNYTEIPAAQYSKYPLIPSLRTIGINQVLNKAVKDGKIKNTQFSLVSTNHIYRSVNGTYSYYKYDLSLKNAQNDQLNTIFEVRYDNNTKRTLIIATQYSVKYAPTTPTTPTNNTGNTNTTNPNGNNTGTPNTNQTTPTPAYVLVPATQYNSTLILGLANFGAASIVKSAISNGKLPAGNYTVTSIQSVYKQVLKTLTNYKYVVVITKSDASRIVDANFTIAYNPSTKNQTVAASGYSVRPWNATNPTGNNTGNPNTNQTTPTPAYVLVPAAQYNSTLISGLANFGAASIVKSGISNGKLPAGNYTVTSIQSVYKQVLKTLTNYKYVVVITKSDASRVVDANFTIAYNPSTKNQTVAASGYSVRPWSV